MSQKHGNETGVLPRTAVLKGTTFQGTTRWALLGELTKRQVLTHRRVWLVL